MMSFLLIELVYDGRILKSGKQVVDYDVVAGCTIHVMLIKPKKSKLWSLFC